MFKALKRSNLLSNGFAAICFLAATIILSAVCFKGLVSLVSPKANLDELQADQIQEGMIVKSTVYFVMDYYAYTTEDNKVTEKEYLIPVGEAEYMGLVVRGGKIKKLDANIDPTWEYLEGTIAAADKLVPVEVTGTIRPITGESLGFYKAYVKDTGLTEEEQEIFLPLELNTNYIGNWNKTTLIGLSIFTFFIFVLGVIYLILALVGGTASKVRAYCKSTGSEEYTMQKLEQFYANTEPFHKKLRVSDDYILFISGGSSAFAPADKLIWMYQHVVKHTLYYVIPIGKTYTIRLNLSDGKMTQIPCKNRQECELLLEYLSQRLPHVLVGYTDELNRAYQKDREGLIRAVAHRREFGENEGINATDNE